MTGVQQNATETIGNNTSNVDFLNTTRLAAVSFVPRIIINKNVKNSSIVASVIAPTTTTSTTTVSTTLDNQNYTVGLQNVSTTAEVITTTATTPIASSSISVSSTSTTTIKPTFTRVFANKGRYNFNSMLARTSSSISLNKVNL